MKARSTLLALAFTTLVAGQAHSAAVLTGLWEFEEIAGTSATDSVGSLPGDVGGGASLSATGRFGSGIDFGTDVTIAGNVTTTTAAGNAATQQTGDFSVLVWVQPTVADISDNFVRFIDTSSNTGAITSGYRLMGNNTGNQFQFLGDMGASTVANVHPRSLAADTWTLLAVRYEVGGNVTTNVLMDGDAVTSAFVGTNSSAVAASGAIVYAASEDTDFGAQDGNSPALTINEFDGLMDDAAFFSGLLTDDEVAAVFNSGVGTVFIPEPSSAILLMGGLLGLVVRRRR